MTRMHRTLISTLAGATALWLGAAAQSQPLAGDALVDALDDGGHVIVMRHARSPSDPPGPRETMPGNLGGERQLDEHGRVTISAVGYAFREMGIPVGRVLSSPAFRARETAAWFGLGDLHVAAELGGSNGDAEWLRERVGETPADGANTILITHAGNLRAAFGGDAADMQDGEALVYRPGRDGGELVARLTIKDWAKLALR